MFVYTIIENGEVYPNAFASYKNALDEVKKKYNNWNDNEENEVNVKEGHKINKNNKDSYITELYIEKDIHIFIHKLPMKINTLRRHSIGGRYNKKNISRKKENYNIGV